MGYPHKISFKGKLAIIKARVFVIIGTYVQRNAFNYFEDNQKVTFRELKSTPKIGYNWLQICGVILFFSLSAAGGARKLMKRRQMFSSPGKLVKIRAVFLIVFCMQVFFI